MATYYPEGASIYHANVRQYIRLEVALEEKLRDEVSAAYFGTKVEDGKPLTPVQVAEIAANAARVAVLSVFAAQGDARDVKT